MFSDSTRSVVRGLIFFALAEAVTFGVLLSLAVPLH